MSDDRDKGVCVVFGATGCVGRDLVRRLSGRGRRVVAAGRDPRRLEELQSDGVETAEVDVSVPKTFDEIIESSGRRHGQVSAVVNCIGSILLKPVHLTSDDELQGVLQANLWSSFFALRAAARAMRSSGGAVVFFSTAAARIGVPSHEAIAAAKAGVEGMARSAAATYARSGIRVNVIAPGLIRSEMSRGIWENEASASASRDMHALGRLGEPEEIASLACWLLEPENSWMTGQVIALDGGLSSVVQRQRR